MKKVFEIIKSAYQSLWHMKDYGNTLEIITPVATMNNMFVSVFITKRGDEYVATDGGWIESGMYETEVNLEGASLKKILEFYVSTLDISTTAVERRTFYFKKINRLELVPNIVFDMANFINAIISSSQVQFVTDKIEASFKKKVQNFFNKELGEGRFEYDRPVGPDSYVRFNAIDRKDPNGLILINFVSGFNVTNFTNSLCRSECNFEIIKPKRNQYKIKKTITIFDDKKASVIASKQVQSYIGFLSAKQDEDNSVYYWSQSKKLLEAV